MNATANWPEPELPDVTLKMTMEEAGDLYRLLGNVGGDGPIYLVARAARNSLFDVIRPGTYKDTEAYIKSCMYTYERQP